MEKQQNMTMKVIKYEPDHKSVWDEFIKRSKNGVFLFLRDYIEYHSDRFTDHSLMFLEDDTLIAVMPANMKDDVLISHGGLTFGGVISDNKMKITPMLAVFEAVIGYMRKFEFRKLVYKVTPHIYHSKPSEEDLYALFINKATLLRRDFSAAIRMKERLRFSKGRKHSIKKAKKMEVEVRRSEDFETFMDIEEFVLKKYHNTKPVHSSDEIKLLAKRFPKNIKLFGAYKKETMLAGTIIYESKNVAHAQYIASIDEGKEIGASDIIFDYLLNEYYDNKRYFDFGISTEDEGWYLNAGLALNKETFGGRGVVYDWYEINLGDS